MKIHLLLAVILCGCLRPVSTATREVSLYQQAVDLNNAEEYDQAIKLYSKVLELEPEHDDAYWNWGKIYQGQDIYGSHGRIHLRRQRST